MGQLFSRCASVAMATASFAIISPAAFAIHWRRAEQ